jgi:hypothetical protein
MAVGFAGPVTVQRSNGSENGLQASPPEWLIMDVMLTTSRPAPSPPVPSSRGHTQAALVLSQAIWSTSHLNWTIHAHGVDRRRPRRRCTARLVWLADSIHLRLPHVLVPVSAGDLLLFAGVIALVVTAMRRRMAAEGAGPVVKPPRSPPARRVRDLEATLPRAMPSRSGPVSMRPRENGAHGPTSVRRTAGRRLNQSDPPQVSGVLPGQVR